ncbi:MAG TPA: adenosylmethionine decarboxylase [Desulfosarcina sp.]|nr:adenosylmethionine decarboxylase [Desulfosarcina sp.]
MGERGPAASRQVVEFGPAMSRDRWPEYVDTGVGDTAKDHFVSREGRVYAGRHLILDFWGAKALDDPALMERTLRRCVRKAGATLLHIHLHRFSPSGGLSGVAVLAESHISVHTWPENDFAAFDIFMCGDASPEKAAEVLKQAFQPDAVSTARHLRGIADAP